MAGKEISSLLVRIGSDTSELLDGIKKSESAMLKLGKIGAQAGAKLAGSALAAGAAVAALAVKGVQLADEMAEAADKIGITADALAQMRYAAQFAGLSSDDLDNALLKLGKSVSEASLGLATQKRALDQLGLSAAELEKLPLDEQMLRVGDAMQGVTNQTDKLRIASDLFGRGPGAKMVALFKDGTAAMREQMEEAKRLGQTLDATQVRTVSEAADAQDKLKSAVSGLSMQLGATFAPAMEAAANAIVDLTAGVIDALPKLAGLASIFLGIRRAAEDMALNDLQEELLLINVRLDDLAVSRQRLEESLANRNLFAKGSLAATIEEQNELLERQAELQAQIDALRSQEQQQQQTQSSDSSDSAEELARLREQENARVVEIETMLFNLFEGIKEKEQEAALAMEETIFNALGMQQEETAARFEELRKRYDSELTLEQERYMRELAILQEAEDARIVAIEEIHAMREQIEQEHQDRLSEIANKGASQRQKFEEMTLGQKIQSNIGAAVQILAGVAQHNKKLFNIQKAAALAQAAVTLPAAIIEAVKNGGGLPWGAIPGALTAAAGAAQIAAIKKTTFEGGGAGTTPSLAGSTPTVNSQPAQQAPERVVTVRGLDANQLFSGRQIAELLQTAINDGTKLVLTR